MDDGIQVLDTDIPIIEDTPVVDDTTYTPYERINFENGTLVSPGFVDSETGEITMPVYSGKAPANAQNLNHLEDGIKNLENYVLKHSGSSGGGGGSEPVGTVKAYAGTTIPDGYLMCDGSQVLKTDYGELFAVLGTAFNLSSDTDSTKFRLPDLRGRVIVGVGSFDTTHSFTLAKTGGEYEHLLTLQELPNDNVCFSQSGSGNFIASYTTTHNGAFSADEIVGQPHNNTQPYLALKYIIKAVKTTTLGAETENNLESDSTTNAPTVHAVNQIKHENLVISGSPARCGYKIDEKDVYVKRIKIQSLPSQANQETSYDVGLNLSQIDVINLTGVAKSNTVTFPLPFVSNNQIIVYLNQSTNKLIIQCTNDRSSYSAFINIYFTYKN